MSCLSIGESRFYFPLFEYKQKLARFAPFHNFYFFPMVLISSPRLHGSSGSRPRFAGRASFACAWPRRFFIRSLQSSSTWPAPSSMTRRSGSGRRSFSPPCPASRSPPASFRRTYRYCRPAARQNRSAEGRRLRF